MNLQSSYIFIDQTNRELKRDAQGNYCLELSDNILTRLRTIVPNLTRTPTPIFGIKSIYSGALNLGTRAVDVTCITCHVGKNTYLDVSISAQTKAEAVKAIEHIQNQLLDDNLGKQYIPIVSYDAVSEYFCNKTFPLLNSLERNLRKLLFNTYTVQFGKNYYQTTISEEIQEKAKQRIAAKGNKQTIEVRRIQEFFYSLEYGDIESMLFTPRWTEIEEEKRRKLLENHTDLTQLTDAELREEISMIHPLSDWDRFFWQKTCLGDMKSAMRQLRLYRNKVANVKFFTRNDYIECSKLLRQLNAAILEAIQLTEKNDFVQKNEAALCAAVVNVVKRMESFYQWIGDRILKTSQTLTPIFEKIGRMAIYANQDPTDIDDSMVVDHDSASKE